MRKPHSAASSARPSFLQPAATAKIDGGPNPSSKPNQVAPASHAGSTAAPAPATRFASSIARELMEKFPTEESAKAQLVYTQLQLEALVDMNAKLQGALREANKQRSNAGVAATAAAAAAAAAAAPPASGLDDSSSLHLNVSGVSGSEAAAAARAVDAAVERIIDALDPARARTPQLHLHSHHGVVQTPTPQHFHLPPAGASLASGHGFAAAPHWSQQQQQQQQQQQLLPSPSLSLAADKLASVALPLALMAAESLRKLQSELDDARFQLSDFAMRESVCESVSKQREAQLRQDLQQSREAERAAVAKSAELARQLHYLKQFQLALCASADADGGDGSEDELDGMLECDDDDDDDDNAVEAAPRSTNVSASNISTMRSATGNSSRVNTSNNAARISDKQQRVEDAARLMQMLIAPPRSATKQAAAAARGSRGALDDSCL